EPGPVGGRPPDRRVGLPQPPLPRPGAAARVPAQLREPAARARDARPHLSARPRLLRPPDRLGHKLAGLVINPTEARERLSQYIYWTLEPTNPLGLLQEALLLAVQLEPLEKRIRVEGVKTGKVTALDPPGRIQQALAAGIVAETEAA